MKKEKKENIVYTNQWRKRFQRSLFELYRIVRNYFNSKLENIESFTIDLYLVSSYYLLNKTKSRGGSIFLVCKVRKSGVDRVHLSHDLSLKRFIFSPVHDLIITMLIRWSIIARVYRDYRSNRYKKKKGRKKKEIKKRKKKNVVTVVAIS